MRELCYAVCAPRSRRRRRIRVASSLPRAVIALDRLMSALGGTPSAGRTRLSRPHACGVRFTVMERERGVMNLSLGMLFVFVLAVPWFHH